MPIMSGSTKEALGANARPPEMISRIMACSDCLRKKWFESWKYNNCDNRHTMGSYITLMKFYSIPRGLCVQRWIITCGAERSITPTQVGCSLERRKMSCMHQFNATHRIIFWDRSIMNAWDNTNIMGCLRHPNDISLILLWQEKGKNKIKFNIICVIKHYF